MKYLSLALIVMSVSAVPVSGMIVAGKYNKEVDFGEWTFVSLIKKTFYLENLSKPVIKSYSIQGICLPYITVKC